MSEIIERYFSWDDFLNYANWQEPNSYERSHDTDDTKWFGTPNFESAMRLARYGWTEYMDQIKTTNPDCWDMLNNLQLWETKHSVVGSGVDMGRYVIGMPDCMSYQDSYLNDRFHATPKFVNIVVNVSYSWTRDYEYVLQRGLDVISAINTLEINNVKTRVILLTNNRGYYRHDLYRIFINIKDYQDIFYLEKLMFPIAHTSFLRRIVFSVQEREPAYIREEMGFYTGHGYGKLTNEFEYDDKNTLYFGTEPVPEYKITKWIRKVLAGRAEDYDGNADLDKHLEELKQQTGSDEISEELMEYMKEKAERYKQNRQARERAEQQAEAKHRADQGQQNSGGGSSSGQSENQSQQKNDNDKNLLPVLRQTLVPVLTSHYVQQNGGLPVPLSFYQQNQIVR